MSGIVVDEFKWYLVLTDDNGHYITAYGYDKKPIILDLKYTFDALINDKELKQYFPDLANVADYMNVDLMKAKKFESFLEKETKRIEKEANKTKKKKKKK